MYLISNDKDKSKVDTIFIRNILPAAVISLLVFVIIKFKDLFCILIKLKENE